MGEDARRGLSLLRFFARAGPLRMGTNKPNPMCLFEME
jgi:hypothetical protein